jgi:hypothetical protein
MEIATKAARKAAQPSFAFREGCRQSVEDLAGDIVAEYLSNHGELDRAEDQFGFEIWCYALARKLRTNYRNRNEVNAEDVSTKHISNKRDRENNENAFDFLKSGSISGRQRPMQEIHMEVLDVLRFVSLLPRAESELVLSIVDYGDVTEFAKDRKISLYDAMVDLQRARTIMSRLRDDEDDGNKETLQPRRVTTSYVSHEHFPGGKPQLALVDEVDPDVDLDVHPADAQRERVWQDQPWLFRPIKKRMR